MFNSERMLALLDARPFEPFRLFVGESEFVDILSPKMAIPGFNFAVVGILEPEKSERLISCWVTVWYEQVTRFGLLPLGVNPEDVWQASREEEAGQLIPP